MDGKCAPSFFQRLPDSRRYDGSFLVHRERHRPLEPVWPREEHLNAAAKRVRRDPGFEGRGHVLAARFDGGFDALAAGNADWRRATESLCERSMCDSIQLRASATSTLPSAVTGMPFWTICETRALLTCRRFANSDFRSVSIG